MGKLYISYPMVESIKEISIEKQQYDDFYLPLSESANYKRRVGGVSDFSDFRKITKNMWYAACNASVKQALLIVSFGNKSDYQKYIEQVGQKQIYDAQKKRFVQLNNAIGILNSVPLFLIEYYGETFWNMVVTDSASM
ncbi:MAG: hypothetical protein NC413_00190 [Muribaculum sp.]|nr:hypothetical protein [Muribaculum sp.]